MKELSEYLRVAVTSDGLMTDISNVDIDAYQNMKRKDKTSYYCAECKKSHGRDVHVVPMRGHFHRYAQEKSDPQTGFPILYPDGEIVTRSNTLWVPAHFRRASGAAKHSCEHPVAYADFNSTALYLNGYRTDNEAHGYLFKLMPPRHGLMDQDVLSSQPSFRPKGMRVSGVRDARDFGKLLDHFEDHPGLQHRQAFADAQGEKRFFTEVHFENGMALFDYLERRRAVGRGNAIVCSYVMNPNTSREARSYLDEDNVYIDRNVSMLEDGRKLNIFVSGANEQSIEALSAATKLYAKTHIHVFAPCWIEPQDERAHRVEMEIYDPRQVNVWNRKGGFVPPYRLRGGNNDLVLPL